MHALLKTSLMFAAVALICVALNSQSQAAPPHGVGHAVAKHALGYVHHGIHTGHWGHHPHHSFYRPPHHGHHGYHRPHHYGHGYYHRPYYRPGCHGYHW